MRGDGGASVAAAAAAHVFASFPGIPSRQNPCYGLRNAEGYRTPSGPVRDTKLSGCRGRNLQDESYLKRGL
jgi:hypothetical protein